MIKDNNNVIYSDDMKTLINGSQCDALIYKVPEGVERIEEKAFEGNSVTAMITLPKTCDVLGEYAFANMQNLEYVNMEETSIEAIRRLCFVNCHNLRCVSFPKTLMIVQDRAFSNTSIEKIDMTKDFPNVINFDPEAFWYMDIKELIANKLQSEMFRGCDKLERVTIADGTDYVGYHCFYGCTSLKEVYFPDSIREIYSYAFCDCPIETLTLPKELCGFGSMTFKWRALRQVINRSQFIIEDDTLYSNDKRTLIGCWANTTEQIKDPDVCITEGAFTGNDKITSIDLTLRRGVPRACFTDMPSLVSVKLHTWTICENAFSGCKNLKKVQLAGCQRCEDYAFKDCMNLKTFEAEGLLVIRDNCFSGCQNLQDLKFLGMRYIGDFAFRGCDSITHIQLRDPSDHDSARLILKRHCFAGMGGLKEIEIPDGVESLNHNFDDCISLEKVKLPPSIQKISFGSLGSNCPVLKEILVPKSELSRFQGMLNKKYHSLLKTY